MTVLLSFFEPDRTGIWHCKVCGHAQPTHEAGCPLVMLHEDLRTVVAEIARCVAEVREVTVKIEQTLKGETEAQGLPDTL